MTTKETLRSLQTSVWDRVRNSVLGIACPSTARVYALKVPPNTKTCEEAQKWLRGDKEISIVGRS